MSGLSAASRGSRRDWLEEAENRDVAGRNDEDRPLDHGAGPGALPDRPEDRDRRRGRAALPRRLRDLRPRQRHLPLRGAGGGEGRVSDLARAERAVDGARRGRLRQGEAPPADHGGALLDRPGRRQHDHRRRRAPWRTGCRSSSSPATFSPTAGPTRCCSRSSTSTIRPRR